MDHLHAAFGAFEPQRDPLAALKFSVNVVLMDGRIDDLALMLQAGSPVGGLGGEPGWELDRVDRDALEFVARVDREKFSLAHPVLRCNRAELLAVLDPMLAAYAAANPQDATRVAHLRQSMRPIS